MSERVLNFSEFFTKYSKDGQDDKASLDNLTSAAANFEEGFDKDTYDQAPLGPKKPVAASAEVTPPQPGEQGAPAFTDETEEDMSAPAEEAPVETEGEEEEAAVEPSKETEETPEPEAGANPKEKVEEGLVLGFSAFINEDLYDDDDELRTEDEGEELEEDPLAYLNDDDDFEDPLAHLKDEDYEDDSFENEPDLLGANPFDDSEDIMGDDYFDTESDDSEEEFGANPFSEDEDGYGKDEYEYCDDCGEPIYYTEEGASCGCNM